MHSLMQLQHNNVGMAVDWLLNNPEEPPEAAPPPPSDAPTAEIAKSFPDADEQPQASSSKHQASSVQGVSQSVLPLEFSCLQSSQLCP